MFLRSFALVACVYWKYNMMMGVLSIPNSVQWHHVGSLEFPMVEVFIPQKWENHMKQGPIDCLVE